MKLNPKSILFGEDTDERGPVLLAVTPPRAGERTLLGVENLLQSIAVPEPFSLELAGDMDGVTLMARCLDDRVVRGQISAHYPQARIQKVDPADDPLRLGEGEQAWSITLRADAPEYVPLRTFRDDDLLDPGSDPLIALLGALTALRPERAHHGAALAAIPGTRLVAAPSGEGPQAPRLRVRGNPPTPSPDQAPPDGRHYHGSPGASAALASLKVLPVGAGRGDMEGRAAWRGNGPWEWSSGAWALCTAGRRPASRIEDPILIREKVSRVAFDAELQIVDGASCRRPREPQRASRAARRRWPPPTATTTTRPERASRWGGSRPAETPNAALLHPSAAPDSSAGAAFWACGRPPRLWHPPGAGDETPLVERSGARALNPLGQGRPKGGALVGDTTAGAQAAHPIPRRPAAQAPSLRGKDPHG